MELIDTHCHIHFDDFGVDPEVAIVGAKKAGVNKLICVGCTLADSKKAIEFAEKYDNIWASAGVHPHDGASIADNPEALKELKGLLQHPKVVAVGEIGLDYFRSATPKEVQEKALRQQIEVALEAKLPIIFHVRDAWEDFWQILADYQGIKGEIHSFTGHLKELDQALSHNLYIGVNGIVTFTKDDKQLEAFKAIPADKLLLETDAPFLTPSPFRGKVCVPEYVEVTAGFLAGLRGETLEVVAKSSASNALTLFQLK